MNAMERFSATMDTVHQYIKQLGFSLAILNAPRWVSNKKSVTITIENQFLGKMLRSYKYDKKWNPEKTKYKQKLVTS